MPQAVAGSLETASLVGRPAAQKTTTPGGRPVGGEKARLIVQSFTPIALNVGFHYVQRTIRTTGPAPLGVHANRTQDPAREERIVRQINRIYRPQANIVFKAVHSEIVHNNGVQPPHVDANRVRTDAQGRDDVDLITTSGGIGQLRVYFVGRIGGATGDFGAVAPIGDRVTVCQDSLTLDDQSKLAVTQDVRVIGGTLAHEFGHCFGEDHAKTSNEDLLMGEKGGHRIPLDVARRMRRAAALK
jgi:hypothetical protein